MSVLSWLRCEGVWFVHSVNGLCDRRRSGKNRKCVNSLASRAGVPKGRLAISFIKASSRVGGSIQKEAVARAIFVTSSTSQMRAR
jgi:hypothetical protein